MTQAIVISKQGIDAGTATNPNDFIFHSDYNTFKIVAQGTTAINVSGAILPSASFAHNSPLGTTTAIFVFVKFPDGKTTSASISNGVAPYSYDGSHFVANTYWDNTDITMQFSGGTYSVNVAWMVYEAGVT